MNSILLKSYQVLDVFLNYNVQLWDVHKMQKVQVLFSSNESVARYGSLNYISYNKYAAVLSAFVVNH